MASSSSSSLYSALDVRGMTVLITGASSGFGEAIAWRCAELGCKLVLIARRTERLTELSSAIVAKFPGTLTHAVTLDVRDLTAIAELSAKLPSEFAEVDILINNAGLALGTAGVQDNDIEQMRAMMETNVLGVMAMTKAFTKGMVKRNRGHVINIGSTAGHEAYPGGSGYCASKFALRAFTSAARDDLVGTNIRVTLISPGSAETEFSLVRYSGDKDKAAAVYKGMAAMNAHDVADNVIYALTRPAHVQIADIVVMCVHQAGAKTIARPML